ncbi:Myb-like DNA-binding domain containing protein [Trichomonas vaginalis G3]|uniref:Myb-like DNA-binding domain containing protein n=1 Tax=Trichomonas vaginalis (strain ATCC PRA-98 / G3) TaxID=412133 RepID=A2F535_TRIV3|nr:MYB protein-related family [Trichomonas vaginalis G3]EAX99978.1 Myb-like DNA-binding domain containing protein [Trichomonas vaginalis G3]KAI5519790.1 MYB protein-related family [Trichomonas vaginalis G3]|eukprot:XP_001312908.1 Myb-like DNA-binding domain containing protein [Trichomonas vaginalis G3]
MYSRNDILRSTKRARNHFSQEEDTMLLSLISSFKKCEIDWEEISRIMKRTVRQCKDRYNNYLINKNQNKDFTNDELMKIIQLYSIIGPHWVEISRFFQERTDIDIKLAFKRLERRKISTETSFQLYLSLNKYNNCALKKLYTKRFVCRKTSNKLSFQKDEAAQNMEYIEFSSEYEQSIASGFNEEDIFNEFSEC